MRVVECRLAAMLLTLALGEDKARWQWGTGQALPGGGHEAVRGACVQCCGQMACHLAAMLLALALSGGGQGRVGHWAGPGLWKGMCAAVWSGGVLPGRHAAGPGLGGGQGQVGVQHPIGRPTQTGVEEI